jgi:hypothetical protein
MYLNALGHLIHVDRRRGPRPFVAYTNKRQEFDDQLVAEIDARVDAVCGDAAAVATVKAGKALDIGRTSVHLLMNDGALKYQKIGRSTRVLVPSIKAVLRDGVARPSKPAKLGKTGRAKSPLTRGN